MLLSSHALANIRTQHTASKLVLSITSCNKFSHFLLLRWTIIDKMQHTAL